MKKEMSLVKLSENQSRDVKGGLQGSKPCVNGDIDIGCQYYSGGFCLWEGSPQECGSPV
jgi:hypothetical protein